MSEGMHGYGGVGGVIVVDGEKDWHDFSAFEGINSGVKNAHLVVSFLIYLMYSYVLCLLCFCIES